jgi:hypothetical protein
MPEKGELKEEAEQDEFRRQRGQQKLLKLGRKRRRPGSRHATHTAQTSYGAAAWGV